MVVLALETVTPAGSVAVWTGGDVVSTIGDPSVPHAVRLPTALVAFAESHGTRLDDVSRLAVVSGPGSFTGVRIGMACVQGLAVTRGWPVVPVSSLAALAEGWRQSEANVEPTTVVACLDGMRGEVFVQRFQWDGHTMTSSSEAVVGVPDAIVSEGTSGVQVLVGSGAMRYRAAWPSSMRVMDALEPLAASAARLAARESAVTASPFELRPEYVRRPDVELARERRASHG